MRIGILLYELKEEIIMIKDLFHKYKEIIMYIITGGLTTLVNWIAYAACTHLLPIKNTEHLILISNIAAWILAVLFAYVTNKHWVFQSKTNSIYELFKELAGFIGSRLFTGFVEIFGTSLLVRFGLNQTLFGTEGFLAKIIVSVVVVILNYVLSKLFIFKK